MNVAVVVPLHATDGALGKRSYNSYFSLISALEGGEWSASWSGWILFYLIIFFNTLNVFMQLIYMKL
jgi:hypothetical protein